MVSADVAALYGSTRTTPTLQPVRITASNFTHVNIHLVPWVNSIRLICTLAGFIGGIVTYILLNGIGWCFDWMTKKGVPFVGPSEILLDEQASFYSVTLIGMTRWIWDCLDWAA